MSTSDTFWSFGGESLTCVGKAAPPSPTTPASWTTLTTCSGDRLCQSGTIRGRGTCAENRATAIRTASAVLPSGWGHCSMATTVPAADAWTGAEMNPSATASTSPRSTRSPGRTTIFAGFPACWRTGSTTSSGKGMRWIGSFSVSSFRVGGWTPCRNSKPRITASAVSVELPRARDQLVQTLLLRVQRRAGMDDADRAGFGRPDQLREGAGVHVLDVRLLVGVVGEHPVVDVRALVAARAERRLDVRLHHERVVFGWCGRAGRLRPPPRHNGCPSWSRRPRRSGNGR